MKLRTLMLENEQRDNGGGILTSLSETPSAAFGGPQIICERAHRIHFVYARTVDFLKVEGNYVTIHVGEDRFITRATLKHLSYLLAPYDFLRIERSLLVNMRQVAYLERLEGGRYAFTLQRGQRLISSRERSSAILRLLRDTVRSLDTPQSLLD